MKIYGYFIAKGGDIREDSWTYGDWRQYVCTRRDGALQCARISGFQTFIWLGAMFIGMLAATVAYVAWNVQESLVFWNRVYAMLGVSAFLLLGCVFFLRGGYYLMHAVGPRQYGDRRILPGEEDEYTD